MYKYILFIIFGILLFLLRNHKDNFNIGAPWCIRSIDEMTPSPEAWPRTFDTLESATSAITYAPTGDVDDDFVIIHCDEDGNPSLNLRWCIRSRDGETPSPEAWSRTFDTLESATSAITSPTGDVDDDFVIMNCDEGGNPILSERYRWLDTSLRADLMEGPVDDSVLEAARMQIVEYEALLEEIKGEEYVARFEARQDRITQLYKQIIELRLRIETLKTEIRIINNSIPGVITVNFINDSLELLEMRLNRGQDVNFPEGLSEAAQNQVFGETGMTFTLGGDRGFVRRIQGLAGDRWSIVDAHGGGDGWGSLEMHTIELKRENGIKQTINISTGMLDIKVTFTNSSGGPLILQSFPPESARRQINAGDSHVVRIPAGLFFEDPDADHLSTLDTEERAQFLHERGWPRDLLYEVLQRGPSGTATRSLLHRIAINPAAGDTQTIDMFTGEVYTPYTGDQEILQSNLIDLRRRLDDVTDQLRILQREHDYLAAEHSTENIIYNINDIEDQLILSRVIYTLTMQAYIEAQQAKTLNICSLSPQPAWLPRDHDTGWLRGEDLGDHETGWLRGEDLGDHDTGWLRGEDLGDQQLRIIHTELSIRRKASRDAEIQLQIAMRNDSYRKYFLNQLIDQRDMFSNLQTRYRTAIDVAENTRLLDQAATATYLDIKEKHSLASRRYSQELQTWHALSPDEQQASLDAILQHGPRGAWLRGGITLGTRQDQVNALRLELVEAEGRMEERRTQAFYAARALIIASDNYEEYKRSHMINTDSETGEETEEGFEYLPELIINVISESEVLVLRTSEALDRARIAQERLDETQAEMNQLKEYTEEEIAEEIAEIMNRITPPDPAEALPDTGNTGNTGNTGDGGE